MANNNAKVFAFYSYKGGTGRTTASANVAAMLALEGCRVLCLDLDLEGPGIAIVFRMAEAQPFPLHSYFEGKHKLLKRDFIHYDRIQFPEKSGLWVLPASNRLAGIDTTPGGRLLGQLKRLIDLAEQEIKANIVIIDTPSGFGDLSALSMYVSNCVVALFRYSRQHLLGTAKVYDFVKKSHLPFLAVASCVPPTDYKGEKGKYDEMLKTFYDGPLIEIKEDNSLKWQERIVVGTNARRCAAVAGYRQVANELIKLL